MSDGIHHAEFKIEQWATPSPPPPPPPPPPPLSLSPSLLARATAVCTCRTEAPVLSRVGPESLPERGREGEREMECYSSTGSVSWLQRSLAHRQGPWRPMAAVCGRCGTMATVLYHSAPALHTLHTLHIPCCRRQATAAQCSAAQRSAVQTLCIGPAKGFAQQP